MHSAAELGSKDEHRSQESSPFLRTPTGAEESSYREKDSQSREKFVGIYRDPKEKILKI